MEKITTWYVEEQTNRGIWSIETINPDISGLSRPITIFRGKRATSLITYDWHGNSQTFCPPIWWDLAIGSGACGFGCRACFLMLTHRIRRDPWRHLLYNNCSDFDTAVQKWLLAPKRKTTHTLGIGIDRSDSLLYEGVTEHVRRLAPFFGDDTSNPQQCKMILLTKSINTHYLADIAPDDRRNIVVTFSLNPEEIADLWEGKWPDGERITPSIEKRLDAARLAQDLGFEIRCRLDPIFNPPRWEDQYRTFIEIVANKGLKFSRWTLGTFRMKNQQLDVWREKWGLPEMEWDISAPMVYDGTHFHLPIETRLGIYEYVTKAIQDRFSDAKVSLCKETHDIRKSLKLCNADCNCLF